MIRVGDVTISRVEEVLLHEDTSLFAEWTPGMIPEFRDLVKPGLYDAYFARGRSNLPRFFAFVEANGEDLGEACRWAAAAGAANALNLMAGEVKREDVERLVQQVAVEKLASRSFTGAGGGD